MTIIELIVLLQARIIFLNQQRLNAEQIGDVSRINAIDCEIIETELSLDRLRNIN